MTNTLRVGVIGLGARWRKRYRPALLALRDEFQVRALCDASGAMAKEEGRLFSCGAVAGPTALLAREDVEAVLMPDPQWFGLWPIEVACRFGKPVLCGVSLEVDYAHAERLHQLVLERRLPVMMETLPGLARLTARLREILDTDLGQPRLILCQWTSPFAGQGGAATEDERSKNGHAVLVSHSSVFAWPGILPLLNWCVSLLKQEPESIVAGASESGGLTSILLQFGNRRAVQVVHYLAPCTHPQLALTIVADRGSVSLSLPDRIRWTNLQGRHTHVLTGDEPHAVKMLDEFYRVVKEGNEPCPSLAESFRALQWLRAARRSWEKGRRLTLTL
jgi:predicted dehydrogenase